MHEITEKLKDYFRSVPEEVTKLPIFEDDRGVWYALGHIDPIEMVLAINDVDKFNNGELTEGSINPEDMQYGYAKVTKVNETPVSEDSVIDPYEDEVTFMTCKPTEEGAFPVTIWNY